MAHQQSERRSPGLSVLAALQCEAARSLTPSLINPERHVALTVTVQRLGCASDPRYKSYLDAPQMQRSQLLWVKCLQNFIQQSRPIIFPTGRLMGEIHSCTFLCVFVSFLHAAMQGLC